MTKKRYKKLLMSMGVPRNEAESATQWGRKNGMKLRRDHLEEDAAVLCFALCADILGVQNYCKSIADLLEFFPVVQKDIESIGENLAAAIEIFRDGVFGDGDGHA